MNVVITGAGRGIGLELCRLALKQGHQVCAILRSLSKSAAMQGLSREYPGQLFFLELDVTSSQVGEKILATVKDWPAVDLLINNAGILETALSEEALLRSFQVNSIAPLMISQALLPKLKSSQSPVIAQITSKMGSISDVQSGGHYAYRASKAALNMMNKCLSLDNPWLTTIVIHPGWVKTDMGGSAAPVQPVDSALGIWTVIEKAKAKKQSGQFFDYQGQQIPW